LMVVADPDTQADNG